MPKNSSPYRKPPVKRTIDSFIDDKNLVERPRIDLGQDTHRFLEIRIKRNQSVLHYMILILP